MGKETGMLKLLAKLLVEGKYMHGLKVSPPKYLVITKERMVHLVITKERMVVLW